ncbi:kynureninase [Antrihabitans stalactiti]|uniref:Kynureninase n=1 Tax=Antrihabitans stalactiti TaxID=2584121 RepID=A0A848KD13_9NOCA|nr:kynureninase [Antrihabitans stalactiti]NMN96161.1 kynureninase [Antrihabitans stalactiti]
MRTEARLDRSGAAELDAADPLRRCRDQFVRPRPDTIYLDGNSLGPPPIATEGVVAQIIREGWGEGLVRSWENWIGWSRQLGDRLAAHTLGAAPGEVVIADSTSVNLFKLAAAAVAARPGRRTVLVDGDDFPTNRYILQGLAAERQLDLRALQSDSDLGLGSDELFRALTEDVALVVLSLVSYRSGALLDMAAITDAARKVGALVLWDLSHAAGVIPIQLGADGADLAIGATYKYLNGGPGSPAFLYVRKGIQQQLRQPIWGWFGQQDQFAMGEVFNPVADIDRFLVGTPPLLSLAAIWPALDVVEQVPVVDVRSKSVLLSEFTIALADEWLTEYGFRLASPRDSTRRGSHVSLAHPEALSISRALREQENVICDFRAPDRLRIGLAPLCTSFTDVWDALDRLRTVMADRRYENLPAATTRVT